MKSRIEELARECGCVIGRISPDSGNMFFPQSMDVMKFANAILELAAKECDKRYMVDLTREDLEAKRCADAIRKLKV